MTGDPLGLLHVASAAVALATGSAVVLLRKGTPRHLLLGRAYFGAMLLLNLSALLIYRLTGHANPFHFFALVSLLSVLAGFAAARRRREGWRRDHARSMSWSYVGLLAAAASEAIVRVPGLVADRVGFGQAVAVATACVTLVGAMLIRRTVSRIG